MKLARDRYRIILGGLFSDWWLLLAIPPYDRSNWALENALVLVFAVAIAVTYRRFPLSRISYTLFFVFLCLHEIGAHYTYQRVPCNERRQQLFGLSLNDLLNSERNHFDRLVHYSYGLLLAYPVREMFIRIAVVSGFWGYFLPLDLTMSTSMLFELFEWGAAYLATQGDVWDAQKDMVSASLGALSAMVITAMINFRLQRDFAREWNDSLRVKGRDPLGEDAIMKMWKEDQEENL